VPKERGGEKKGAVVANVVVADADYGKEKRGREKRLSGSDPESKGLVETSRRRKKKKREKEGPDPDPTPRRNRVRKKKGGGSSSERLASEQGELGKQKKETLLRATVRRWTGGRGGKARYSVPMCLNLHQRPVRSRKKRRDSRFGGPRCASVLDDHYGRKRKGEESLSLSSSRWRRHSSKCGGREKRKREEGGLLAAHGSPGAEKKKRGRSATCSRSSLPGL